MITLRCPWESPPLRSNQRLHWGAKAKLTRQVRSDAGAIAHARRRHDPIWIDQPVIITMIWTVTDHRRRDVGAMAPTLKAWIDGLVDGGMLPGGDHHEIVAEERMRIEVGARRCVRVEIEAA